MFVHPFGGSPKSIARHMTMINEMGFDAVAFQLKFNQLQFRATLPLSRQYRFGVREIWAEQISDVLNLIPESKILYTFSSPSSAALLSMARRQANDIKAWICDGGPFSQMRRCLWNLFTHQYPEPNLLLRALKVSLAEQWLGGIRYRPSSYRALSQLPTHFPVLSIRAWNDLLVPTQAIEEFFTDQNHLALEVLSIPEVGHLQGLSKAPVEYKHRVNQFIQQVSTPLDKTEMNGDHSPGRPL